MAMFDSNSRSVLQPWVMKLPFMQQTVLISAIRGCDGISKYHKTKPLVRWYRRCVLLSAFEGKVITDPFALGGGSFTGPVAVAPNFGVQTPGQEESYKELVMEQTVKDFYDSGDELPAHYSHHMMCAFEITGYKHPNDGIREFWRSLYLRLAHGHHLWPETEEQMDLRLGDSEESWKAREA